MQHRADATSCGNVQIAIADDVAFIFLSELTSHLCRKVLPDNVFRNSFSCAAGILSTILIGSLPGCATFPSRAAVSNPVMVRANNPDDAWERTVDVVHEYLFEIERENKLGGMLETRYKTGASVVEPWHRDSVGMANRVESTLQSIRRKAYLSVTPVDGGYLIGVEAHKELEDVAKAANLQGAATFLDDAVLQRDLNAVVGQATPSGWVSKGRDVALEQAMLHSIQRAFGN